MKKLLLMMAVVMTAMLTACGGSNKAKEEAAPEEAAVVEDLDFIRMNCMLTVSAENKAKAIELAKELVAASQNDEGVIEYDVLESVSRPDKLFIFETWTDQASLDKHMASKHFTTLVPQIQELGNLEIKQINQPKEVNLDTTKPFRFNIMMTTNQRDAYIEVVKSVIEGTRKNDVGNIDYDYFNSLTRPDKTMLLEIWESQEGLDAHMKAPHFTEARPKTEGMVQSTEFTRMQE